MNSDFNYLSNTSYDLNQEIKNLISSINDEDEIRKRYHETQVETLLRRLIDDINTSKILRGFFLQIKFGKRYNSYLKDLVSLTNFD